MSNAGHARADTAGKHARWVAGVGARAVQVGSSALFPCIRNVEAGRRARAKARRFCAANV